MNSPTGEALLHLAEDLTKETGRLEELNGHGRLSGQLWGPQGSRWLCLFQPEHFDQLKSAWMQTIEVVGRVIHEKEQEPRLEVQTFTILVPQVTAAEEIAGEFWQSFPLEELARQQGVSSISNLDELRQVGPVDEHDNDLLEYVLQERRVRRAVGEEGLD